MPLTETLSTTNASTGQKGDKGRGTQLHDGGLATSRSDDIQTEAETTKSGSFIVSFVDREVVTLGGNSPSPCSFPLLLPESKRGIVPHGVSESCLTDITEDCDLSEFDLSNFDPSIKDDTIYEGEDENSYSDLNEVRQNFERSADLEEKKKEEAHELLNPPYEQVDAIPPPNSESKVEDDDIEQASPIDGPAFTVSQTQARRPILKKFKLDEILISNRRFAWRQLPRPKSDSRERNRLCGSTLECSSGTKESLDNRPVASSEERKVSFGTVWIREYDQTIGDNPSVSYGTPISLDWGYLEFEGIALNVYEATRGRRRNLRQMQLNYYNRRNILSFAFGSSEDDLHDAERQANKIKRSRAITRALLPAQKLEEVLQSARRKAYRIARNSR